MFWKKKHESFSESSTLTCRVGGWFGYDTSDVARARWTEHPPSIDFPKHDPKEAEIECTLKRNGEINSTRHFFPIFVFSYTCTSREKKKKMLKCKCAIIIFTPSLKCCVGVCKCLQKNSKLVLVTWKTFHPVTFIFPFQRSISFSTLIVKLKCGETAENGVENGWSGKSFVATAWRVWTKSNFHV